MQICKDIIPMLPNPPPTGYDQWIESGSSGIYLGSIMYIVIRSPGEGNVSRAIEIDPMENETDPETSCYLLTQWSPKKSVF